MRKEILQQLIDSLKRIKIENGYNTDIKDVTLKVLHPNDIDFSNMPIIELFSLDTTVKYTGDAREYTWNLGMIVWFKVATDNYMISEYEITNAVEDFIEDFDRFIDSSDFNVDNIIGFEIKLIAPYVDNNSSIANIFYTLQINYLN